MSALHSEQTPTDGIHVVTKWEYANAAARDAASYSASDVGGIARVGASAPYDFYVLLNDTGPAWGKITAGEVGGVKAVFLSGTDYNADKGDWRGNGTGSNGSQNFSFRVPDDFGSLVSLELIALATGSNAAADIDLNSDYGAVGESDTTHSESDTTSTYNITQDEVNAMDISGVFSSIAAGDYCGLMVTHNAIGHVNGYLGILLKYNPA